MTRKYFLKGLKCPNCATKIESSIKSQSDVNMASVNFINTTLIVEFTHNNQKRARSIVEKLVHKYEPDIIVTEKSGSIIKEKLHNDKDFIIIIIGAVIFGFGVLINQLTDLNIYIKLSVFLISYLILGGKILLKAVLSISKGLIFDENFLMSIATIGAFATRNFIEAVAVMLLYQIGEYFQTLAVSRSKKSIADLMEIRPDYANLKVDNKIIRIHPQKLNLGDIIVVKPGEKIPVDGTVINGESMLDTMALTGESLPRRAGVLDTVLSGCVNQSGVLTIKVTKTFGESTVSKIINLVENASSKKAAAENFITKFSKYYTPVVVGVAVILAIVPPLFFGGTWVEWVNRSLIFLVISCPCALVISVPLSFFGGIGKASKNGVLIKGSNYLEALNNVEIVVFDKTGTLTKGVFKVVKVEASKGYTKEKLLETAAYAEALSNHPIAKSIIESYGKKVIEEKIKNYSEIPGYGISADIFGKRVLAGNLKLMKLKGISTCKCNDQGTKIYVALEGVFIGYIVISDEIKADSLNAISKLKLRGVKKIVMLTGDDKNTARFIANKLNLDESYGGLLPYQKVEKLEELQKQKSAKGKIAFVGDGINDAPVLARADIGIAMGAFGSDAAIEAADVVLMTDEPSKLAEAVDIAKFTRRIVWQNIIFALFVKLLFLLLGAFGAANIWEAIFADVGVSVLAIFNSIRVINAKL